MASPRIAPKAMPRIFTIGLVGFGEVYTASPSGGGPGGDQHAGPPRRRLCRNTRPPASFYRRGPGGRTVVTSSVRVVQSEPAGTGAGPRSKPRAPSVERVGGV